MQPLRVRCGQAGTLDTVAWATNLQANASAAGALNLAGVAASPATGGLLLAGEFAGQMAFGAHTLTAAGGTDAFAAELDPVNGCGGLPPHFCCGTPAWHACAATWTSPMSASDMHAHGQAPAMLLQAAGFGRGCPVLS